MYEMAMPDHLTTTTEPWYAFAAVSERAVAFPEGRAYLLESDDVWMQQ